MSHSDNQAKTIADSGLQQGQNVAAAAAMNPYVAAVTNEAGQDLTDISAGKFGGLPLVEAVNQAGLRARSWKPQAMGDAALASSEEGIGGYATQEEAYRQRQISDMIGNLMPEAVQAERNYDTSVLFPGAQQLSAFELAKSGALTGNANAAANLYNISGNMGFWNKFVGGFGSALGNTLGGGNVHVSGTPGDFGF